MISPCVSYIYETLWNDIGQLFVYIDFELTMKNKNAYSVVSGNNSQQKFPPKGIYVYLVGWYIILDVSI